MSARVGKGWVVVVVVVVVVGISVVVGGNATPSIKSIIKPLLPFLGDGIGNGSSCDDGKSLSDSVSGSSCIMGSCCCNVEREALPDPGVRLHVSLSLSKTSLSKHIPELSLIRRSPKAMGGYGVRMVCVCMRGMLVYMSEYMSWYMSDMWVGCEWVCG